ncbi:MAG: alginate lyase family protein [Chitinophaga sp.]|uniref:alginate lyase family protein n=1 Tax=Chitinophaga sp. TaxID=1869181 RepID=UPI0025BFADB0|nr:alginate lyase family protein [Chitinophaga sp.]MBV8251264.1 alginate lyase family protein [Chitinophaga sp.]
MKKLVVLLLLFPALLMGQSTFKHPGINQSSEDLAYMKSMVLAGKQPWKGAFDRMMTNLDTAYEVKPFAHVMRGPYGRPNIGGVDLSKSAGLAYDYAVAWYITGKKQYATNAMQLLHAWSENLWDFDYNDAKLMVAWTGHVLCNAAEILKYTDAKWPTAEQDAFKRMLLTIYYPVIKDYYPQANGNWDAAMIHTLMAMAIFLDDRQLFNNAVDHYYHGPVNGSLCRYIYPTGQCQETLRDQGHVQLGIGEFAGAAHIALTQGLNLFEVANHRLLQGYEYTAAYLLGRHVSAYGKISDRAMRFSDFYEPAVSYAAAMKVKFPATFAVADSVRLTASRSILVHTRNPMTVQKNILPKISLMHYMAGAGTGFQPQVSGQVITVTPTDSLQEAMEKAAGTGKTLLLKSGVYTVTATLKIPSNLTMVGEGTGTILHIDPASGDRDVMTNASNDMHDVVLRNLVLDGMAILDYGNDPNSSRSWKPNGSRGGIIFRSEMPTLFRNISLEYITVKNFTYAGVQIFGGEHICIKRCDFNENGSSVVPGAGLLHNLHITHATDARVDSSRMVGAPYGCGLVLDKSSNIKLENCEMGRNAMYGLLALNCSDIAITGSLLEANDKGGMIFPCLHAPNKNIEVRNNVLQCNGGYGIASYATANGTFKDNTFSLNGHLPQQTDISTERKYTY